MKQVIILVFFSILIQTNSKLPEGFVHLDNHVPDIQIDLRYFSSDNFVGEKINGYQSNKCIITLEAADALSDVQDELKSQGLGLKVFDAYRPQQAVDHFVRWAKDLDDIRMKSKFYPNVEKVLLFEEGYISSKSGHSRGSTVDLTLIYLEGKNKGEELDMGTGWDFFSPLSWPGSNQVTADQTANRMLLQKVMTKHGFRHYSKEWWHFTLNDEPFPGTYFNFPVR